MAAKLLAISGPLRKSEFSLVGEITVGRDRANVVCLNDPTVAPRHCRIELNGGRPVLIDLGSQHGTFANGIPVSARELNPGDEIAVGSSIFLVEEDSAASVSSPVEMEQGSAAGARVLELRADELSHLAPDSLAELPEAARMARNLNVLLHISRAVGSLRDEESLPWQLLGLIFDVIPAERGAILLLDAESGEVRSQSAWDRARGLQHPIHINQEIIRRVIDEKVSLLHCSSAQPGGATSSQCTVLCVPMLSGASTIGVIYLESSIPEGAISEDDFRLLTAIAGLGVVAIENARRLESLGSENQRLRAEVSLTHDMVGTSPRMREVFQFIERVAPTDSTVLICGESGTGKELAARAIHKNSPRRNQPFVAINCAAMTETLLESELFGHEKGAFTSAISQKKGFLEVAEGGTLFLDEIGELSPILQAKLLRVLQEREFVRVGGTRPIKINVRFLAATNRDLQNEVRDEKFRGDLFHRLNVISIKLPALREHAEDIPALAAYFSQLHARNCNRTIVGISPEALACLTQYDWPGNIRELGNAMERAVVIGSSDRIVAEDLPDSISEISQVEPAAPAKYHDAVRDLKKQIILDALEQSAGNVTEAAKQLGLHANYLHRLMSSLHLREPLKKHANS